MENDEKVLKAIDTIREYCNSVPLTYCESGSCILDSWCDDYQLQEPRYWENRRKNNGTES